MKNRFWKWFDEMRPRLVGRADTFARMFEHLDTFKRPVDIIETGCIRKADSWEGDGQSTILFERYVQQNGGTVYSVDVDPEATRLASKLTSKWVKVYTGDSVKWLGDLSKDRYKPVVDLLYLDSFDLLVSQPIPAALHHMNELRAAMPLIRPNTLVVVDDSPGIYYDYPFPHVDISGKGMFVAKHAEYVGAEMIFHKYQVGWTHMNDSSGPVVVDESISPLVMRAREHVENGDNINAERLYRIVLGKTTPPTSGMDRVAHGEACLFYARLAVSKTKYGTAADWYREALAADPRAVDYRLELIVKAYRPMANTKIAQQEGIKATRIEPDNPQAWRTLGGVEHELGNVKNCIACYDKQLKLSPDDPNAMLDRITIALDVADYDYSRKLIERVLLTDRKADAIHCLGMIAYREGRHEDAIEYYDKAIAMGCNHQATAHWNKSLALHSIGRYREGWAEHEWRRQERNNPALALPMMRFNLPIWKGEPPPARIHVHAEAGMGDNIAMARYLPMLVERGYDVRYETHEEMFDLMTRSLPGVKVVKKAADYPGVIGIEPFDYHLPVGSLPAVFETDIDTVPWNGPYLKPDPEKVKYYRNAIRRPAVGICWSSGIREGIWIREYGLRKSMHLFELRPIVDNHQALFVSLQVGPEREELGCHLGKPIIDLLPEQPNWDDTAALIECLDLVITVDTAVAHLAGAMGKPVWLMMHTEGSWHWMAERPGALWNEKSPWYPSVRIYRQKKIHEWSDVVVDVARTLKTTVAKAVN